MRDESWRYARPASMHNLPREHKKCFKDTLGMLWGYFNDALGIGMFQGCVRDALGML